MKKVQIPSIYTLTQKTIIVLAIFGIFFSNRALASVVFSEIAWMGGKNSSADEWIELYNTDQSTSLDGFVIESQSGKILIKLSGNIDAQGFYLIERTDDNTLPNIVANLVSTFGTGLSNSGDIIYLKDASGQIIDTLNFASGWPAGDNTTKQTMQKVSNSWVTGEPTPLAKNVSSSGDNAQINTDSQNNSSSNSSGSTSSSSGGLSGTNLSLSNSSPVPKNQSRFILMQNGDLISNTNIDFEIDHRDDYGQKILYGIYKVNFGDGVETAYKNDEKISHIYEYPGQYRVTAKYFESNWSFLPKKQTFININIYEPQISLDLTKAPIIIVKNISNKDLDLSNFVFVVGNKNFTPPRGSIVFAGESLWLSPKVTGFDLNDFVNVSISTISGAQIFNSNSATNLKDQKTFAGQPKIYTQSSVKDFVKSLSSDQAEINLQNSIDTIYKPVNQNDIAMASIANSDLVKNQKPKQFMIWALFAGLIVGGGLVLAKLRRHEVSEADKFTLLEE